ncbi:hypothetical protein DW966_12405 [Bacteroides stercoris]|nr:hypothetical protein DW966_12405 [Bacteroides stercoris]
MKLFYCLSVSFFSFLPGCKDSANQRQNKTNLSVFLCRDAVYLAFGAKIKKIVGWEKEKEIKNFSGTGEVRPAG